MSTSPGNNGEYVACSGDWEEEIGTPVSDTTDVEDEVPFLSAVVYNAGLNISLMTPNPNPQLAALHPLHALSDPMSTAPLPPIQPTQRRNPARLTSYGGLITPSTSVTSTPDVPSGEFTPIGEDDLTLGDDIVTFHVSSGRDFEIFRVNKDLVCRASPMLNAAFNGPFQEGKTQTMKLKKFESTVFAWLIDYLYERGDSNLARFSGKVAGIDDWAWIMCEPQLALQDVVDIRELADYLCIRGMDFRDTVSRFGLINGLGFDAVGYPSRGPTPASIIRSLCTLIEDETSFEKMDTKACESLDFLKKSNTVLPLGNFKDVSYAIQIESFPSTQLSMNSVISDYLKQDYPAPFKRLSLFSKYAEEQCTTKLCIVLGRLLMGPDNAQTDRVVALDSNGQMWALRLFDNSRTFEDGRVVCEWEVCLLREESDEISFENYNQIFGMDLRIEAFHLGSVELLVSALSKEEQEIVPIAFKNVTGWEISSMKSGWDSQDMPNGLWMRT